MAYRVLILQTCLFLLIIIRFESHTHQCIWIAGVAFIFLLLCFIRGKKLNSICYKINLFLLPASLILLSVICTWETICTQASWGKYKIPEADRSRTYAMGKTLILVPHQDDECLLAGGLIDVINKSKNVYVLFSTHGGYPIRMKEALRSLKVQGVLPSNVFCLGFPDFGRVKGNHIYNSEPDQIIEDSDKSTKSHGIRCYRPDTILTRKSFLKNLHDIITEIKPDTIICIDYDSHRDHRALSLLFEETIYDILKQDPSYTPFILKGFAYSTTWHSAPRFYTNNIKSLSSPYKAPFMKEAPCYAWNERLRIPVGNNSLSYTLIGNMARQAFAEHYTQNQKFTNEIKIPTGDKIFWHRPTGNVLLRAEVHGSGININHCNDFKLYDSTNLNDASLRPYAHGWIPDNGNAFIKFTLDKPQVIREIRLYDHIDPDNQIHKLTISLSNGKTLQVSNLPANGSPHIVYTECNEEISGFEITVHEASGPQAGLAEVEAYQNSPTPPVEITKLQDADGNFIYDYMTQKNGNFQFSIYTNTRKPYSVYQKLNNKLILLKPTESASLYSINIASGEEAILQVRNESGTVVDAARIYNATLWERTMRKAFQYVDNFMRIRTIESHYRFFRFCFDVLVWKLGFA